MTLLARRTKLHTAGAAALAAFPHRAFAQTAPVAVRFATSGGRGSSAVTIAGTTISEPVFSYERKHGTVRNVAVRSMESARWANGQHDETAIVAARVSKGDLEAIRNELRPVYGESIDRAEIQWH